MRALVFDLDGTLVEFDREYDRLVAEAIRSVAGRVPEGWVGTYLERFGEAFSALEPDPVGRAFGALDGIDADAAADALCRREAATARPPEGASADLDRLAGRFRLGVVTDGLREWQLRKLRAAGLADRFDAVVASYEAGAHKPDPAPFELLEGRIDADAYAMVGDSDADVAGARGVGWGVHHYEGGGFGDLPGAIDWGPAAGPGDGG